MELFGPLEAVATPGHAPDHFAFVAGPAALTGDAVLGEGSVFIAPDPGALAAYLQALRGLRRRRLAVLGPGHGPPVPIRRPSSTSTLRTASSASGGSSRPSTPARARCPRCSTRPGAKYPALRPAAAITLAAHLDKLADEGRLPDAVQRPVWDSALTRRPAI